MISFIFKHLWLLIIKSLLFCLLSKSFVFIYLFILAALAISITATVL